MEVLLLPLNAFAQHVDIVHVLVLNLIGWVFKGCMQHNGKLVTWTDIIPVKLALIGVILAYVDTNIYVHHPVIQGLANAGLAWLLHQGFKRTQGQVRDYASDKIQGVTQKIRTLRTGNGKKRD